MKKKLIALLMITAMLSLISCDTKKESSSNSDGGTVDIAGDDDDDDDDDTNPNPTGTSACTGTTSDGVGDGGSIFTQDLFLAGGQSWIPGTYSNPLATQTMPSIQNASLLFKSDARLKVRFKVNSQPTPPQGSSDEYCYGRVYPAALDAHLYTKLKFQIVLRDVLCDTPDPNNTNNCSSGFYLGNPYQAQISQPVDVDSCSQVFDIAARRNQTQFGTVVEIADVRSDNTCQANGSFCPAGQSVRPQSCWHMTMQISTDYTQDLK